MVYNAIFRSGILAHKTKVNWDKVLRIKCAEEDVKTLYGCSNTLYYIKTNTIEGYFRPILKHDPIQLCVRKAIVEYFENVHPELAFEKESVQKALSEKETFKKLLDIGSYSDPYSRARKFYLTKDTTVVGIEIPQSFITGSEEWKSFVWNIDHFLKYVMNAMARNQRNQCGGRWEFSNANRQMATEAVATLLGLGRMIPHSEFAVLFFRGKEMKGVLMSVAEGISTEGITEEQSSHMASPELQRELTSLNVLDTITFERDHRPGNYNVVLDARGKVKRLSVFDNDAAMTFAPFPAIVHSGGGSSGIIKGGVFYRPHLDKSLSERITTIKKREVDEALKNYMNWIQITACWRRIKVMRKAIMRSVRKEGFLLDRDEWSEDTMREELSGRFGRTYLDIFIHFETINKSFLEYNTAAPL